MSGTALIYTVFGDADEARKVAVTLITEKLVACANHFAPVTSQYIWDGEMQEDTEYPVLLKTATDKVEAAAARLKSLHSYHTPAIIGWPADIVDADYQAWLDNCLQK